MLDDDGMGGGYNPSANRSKPTSSNNKTVIPKAGGKTDLPRIGGPPKASYNK